jgi:hypothetical protein
MRAARAFCLLLLVFTSSCLGEYFGRSATPAGIVRSIAVLAASVDAPSSAGDTSVVTALLKDVFGLEIPSPEVAWSTSDSTVVTVAGSGSRALVTAVGEGTATITATSEGVNGTIAVTVHDRIVRIGLPAPRTVAAPAERQRAIRRTT